MCAAQGNIASRMLGESTWSKFDPVGGGIQRYDSNHVAPKVAGWLGQVPRGYVAPDNKNAAPAKEVAKPSVAERWGMGPAGSRGASGSMLTGQRTVPKTTLLGG